MRERSGNGANSGGWLIFLLLLSVLPLILYGAAIYYSIRHLRLQLTRRYRLTSTSAMALVVISLGSLLLAMLLFYAYAGIPWFAALILVAPLILGEAILTLELWALSKRLPYRREILWQRREIRWHQARLAELERMREALSRRIQGLEDRYGRPFQEQAELEEIVRGLCRGDAENLALKRRQWEKEFQHLSDRELRRQKREALAKVKARERLEERVPSAIRASLLRLEELERLVGEKAEALGRHQRALERKAREEQELHQKLVEAQQELARLESGYRAFRASRIVLD